MELNRLEELLLQQELKKIILEYLGILYSAHHPNHHGFALLICRHPIDRDVVIHTSSPRRRERRSEHVVIRAIVYTEAAQQNWKIVSESSRANYTITPALQEFSMNLERQMGDMATMQGAREKRRFGEREETGSEEADRARRDSKRRR